jgi:hypothetical protein
MSDVCGVKWICGLRYISYTDDLLIFYWRKLHYCMQFTCTEQLILPLVVQMTQMRCDCNTLKFDQIHRFLFYDSLQFSHYSRNYHIIFASIYSVSTKCHHLVSTYLFITEVPEILTVLVAPSTSIKLGDDRNHLGH